MTDVMDIKRSCTRGVLKTTRKTSVQRRREGTREIGAQEEKGRRLQGQELKDTKNHKGFETVGLGDRSELPT